MSEDYPVIAPKKLIEVALPLDAINAASSREKSIRHGHPSTLHLWWARRPLAAARAVIFSQLVNDPEDLWRCQNPGIEPNKQVRGHWTKARARLFEIIEEIVKWENTTNERVLQRARDEIRKSWLELCELNKNHPQASELFNPEKMPGLHDPFAGGGTIPLEAQRLGLEAVCAIILEQYVSGWRVRKGSTWQVPLPFGKVADFRVNDTIIEFHPIDLKYEFKDPKAFWKFKTHLKSIPSHRADKIVETIKAEKLAVYTHNRKELLANSKDLRHCDLEVCPCDKSFAIAVSNLINVDSAQEIYTNWRNLFETL